jgi:glycine dehydrogenase subunit 2
MNAPNVSGWKPEMGSAEGSAQATNSGDRALMLEEALSFELGRFDATGVDFEAAELEPLASLAGRLRAEPPKLPGLTEPETVRHYTRWDRAR